MKNWLRSWVVAAVVAATSACSTSHVYIVRHAEKRNESDTSSLTPVGQARAQALARELASVSIDSILSTPYLRTRQTAEPLARAKNLPVGTYAPHPTEVVLRRLNDLKGKTVLVVGHSNTILEIAKGLGTRPTLQKIESGDHGNLYHVTIHRSLTGRKVKLEERTYGAP
ncbi:SixA phosphatase family protein [Tellurirhabdus rosea]|uniref:SixA phosphatase family protein n=1 Tax=Tellurirhabdus rosea TaxID=2674997 RepID=UPI0022510D04|nr:phosphoglycerate mutase family protein [Tellurirhabdus rosea]